MIVIKFFIVVCFLYPINVFADVCLPNLTLSKQSRQFSNEAILKVIIERGYGSSNIKLIDDYIRIKYPAGSADPGSHYSNSSIPLGGAGAKIPLNDLSGNCLWLSYKIKIPAGFNYMKGGKLPGLAGGTANTGGNIPNGTDGFSARFMWRAAGKGEIYAYLPSSINWGSSFGGWYFSPEDSWVKIYEMVKLNDVGYSNGVLAAYLGNEFNNVTYNNTITFKTANTFNIDTLYFETFFGGNTSVDYSWVTPVDTYIDMKDFVVATNLQSLNEALLVLESKSSTPANDTNSGSSSGGDSTSDSSSEADSGSSSSGDSASGSSSEADSGSSSSGDSTSGSSGGTASGSSSASSDSSGGSSGGISGSNSSGGSSGTDSGSTSISSLGSTNSISNTVTQGGLSSSQLEAEDAAALFKTREEEPLPESVDGGHSQKSVDGSHSQTIMNGSNSKTVIIFNGATNVVVLGSNKKELLNATKIMGDELIITYDDSINLFLSNSTSIKIYKNGIELDSKTITDNIENKGYLMLN